MYVLLFDIDGTLLASGGAGKAAMEAALAAEFGVRHTIERLQLSGRTDKAIALDAFRLSGVPETAENFRRFIAAYLRNLPDYLNSHKGHVLPGIAELLTRLQVRSDVAVGLLTGNLREGARLKLGHYGIYHHFTFGGFGDHHLGRDDVARDALAAAQRHVRTSLPLDQVWVIGDTPLDIQCARAIGVRVAAVATGWHPLDELAGHRPDLVLSDLTDASALLERMG